MNQVIQNRITALIKPLAHYGIAGFNMRLLFSDCSTFELGISPNEQGNNSGYPIIVIKRPHNECSFVFEGLSGSSRSLPSNWKEKDMKRFEQFCIQFIDSMMDVIIDNNPDYRFSFILSNKELRDAVIRQDYLKAVSLSEREKLCLLLAAQGKKTKVIAKELNISPTTVKHHLKQIRTSLNCDSLTQALFESIQRGIIGKMNPLLTTQCPQ